MNQDIMSGAVGNKHGLVSLGDKDLMTKGYTIKQPLNFSRNGADAQISSERPHCAVRAFRGSSSSILYAWLRSAFQWARLGSELAAAGPEARSRPSYFIQRSGSMDFSITKAALRPTTAALNPLLLTSAAIAVLLFLLLSLPRSFASLRFSIIIDAGSSGTRLHIFPYTIADASLPAIDFGSAPVFKSNPGLSAYETEPDRAGEALMELLELARERVPRESWGVTEIRLMATAGMRLLHARAQERILEACRMVLRSSGFKFRNDWAAVIPGSDEGIYAWVTANFALGTLGGNPEETNGIIELGGASTQVTFVPSEPFPAEFSHVLKFGRRTYNLYTHSFLHFGQNVAHESLLELLSLKDLNNSTEPLQENMFMDPCTPKGFLPGLGYMKLSASVLSPLTEHHPHAHGSGNFSQCRSAALVVLQKEKDKCLYQECRLGSSFVPKLQGRFFATENFFYTSKFFGLGSMPFLSDLVMAGEQFCGEDWSKLRKKYYTEKDEILSLYCFSPAYIVALLHDSLGIALNDDRIVFANQVGDIPLNWALGAFIMKTASNLTAFQSGRVTAIVQNNFLIMFSLPLVSALLVFMVLMVVRWRKPQLKTIYDLEKGRYIVSRVSR